MRSRSLRSRLAILFAIAGTLILLLTAAGSVAYARLLRDRSALVDRIEPAQQHLESLFTAYVNQETGVRGYVLTGDPSFLQPYDQGGKDAVDQSSVLRDTLRDDVQLNRDLEGVDRVAVAWRQQFAQPAIDATREGQRTFASEAELSTSKVLFDDVRGAVDEARDHLRAAVDRAKDRLSTSSDQLAAVLAAAVVVLLATGFLLWRALREWVVEPVAAVAADARAVTAGELVHQVRPVGPPEIEQLARDIEAMRRRIVDDLAAVEAANLAVESANDDLSRSNQELEQFAYVASHDLQEPLRKVASFCQLIEQRYGGQLDERGQQYIDFAVDGAKRMQTLINDLLGFSRVGRTTERFEPVPLGPCVLVALRNLAASIDDSGATVEVSDVLPEVMGDRGLLTALFQNLIGNAIKFRSDLPSHITVAATTTEDEFVLSVEDNGIGIDDRFADRIFVIFQRLHGREAYEGTGIGLAMCRKIVEFHGGRIWLDSEYSPGSRFCFTLPVAVKETPSELDPGRDTDRDLAGRG